MMKMFIKKAKTKIAITQIFCIILMNTFSAFAGVPEVSVDETVYTNLDYYGSRKDLSIVKGVNLNGYSEFQDYGEYTKVINMTSDASPNMASDSVSFTNLDNSKKFYYEVTPISNEVELPWDFDISYKLNGVPAKAESLAGSGGLVEIDVNAKPHATKSEFLNNNMILMVGMNIDMTKNLSVEAPGAQIQSLGTNSVVLFMAFPGEEKDFTIRIGSDSFETSGVVMAMVPATLDSLEKIKDFNEAKDDIKNSVDAIYNSSNELMDVLNSMSGGLGGLNDGLKELQNARAAIHSYSDTLTGQSDAVIENLGILADSASQMVPHLLNAKAAISDLNTDINKIDEEVTYLRPALFELSDSMGEVDRAIRSIGYLLDNAGTDEASASMSELGDKLILSKQKLAQLQSIINGSGILATASSAVGDINIYSMDSSLKELYAGLVGAQIMSSAGGSSAESLYYNSLKNTVLSTDAMYQALDKLVDETGSYIDFASENIAANGVNSIKYIQNGISSGKELSNTSSDMIDEIQITAITIADIIEDMTHVTQTVNAYHDNTLTALDSSAYLMSSVENNINAAADTLSTINNMYRNSRNSLNAGTKDTISASMEVIDRALEGLNITKTLQESNDTVKSIWDDKINELETDSNILKIDTEAVKTSFTSDKNPEPNSVQVILRTEEISIPDDDSIVDMDVDDSNMTPIKRIGNVFKKIFNFIKSFFSGE